MSKCRWTDLKDIDSFAIFSSTWPEEREKDRMSDLQLRDLKGDGSASMKNQSIAG